MHQNMNDKLKNYIFACHFYLYKISFESKCLKKKIGQAKKIKFCVYIICLKYKLQDGKHEMMSLDFLKIK